MIDLSVKHWYDRNSLYIGVVAETPVLLLGIVKVDRDFLSNVQWFWWLHTVGPWIIIQKNHHIYTIYIHVYIYVCVGRRKVRVHGASVY